MSEEEDQTGQDADKRKQETGLDRLGKSARQLHRDLKRHQRQARAEGTRRNDVIKASPKVEWQKEGVLYFYLVGDEQHAQCGYCTFPKPPLIQRDNHGIVAYIPVHGGITYCEDGPNGEMMYGFDCAHKGDLICFEEEALLARVKRGQPLFEFKRYPDEWLRRECEIMGRCILAAARFEPAYLASDGDVEARTRILDNFHRYLREEALGEFQLTDNFGAMLRLLSGDL